MRKPNIIGSSKYEFNPGQFDIDMMNNQRKHIEKVNSIHNEVEKRIIDDPIKAKETYQMYVSILLNMKKKYDL